MIDPLPKTMSPDQQLTTREAGKIAKRHPRTIIAWIKARHLDAFQQPGERGQYRILWKDLKTLLEKKYVPKTETKPSQG